MRKLTDDDAKLVQREVGKILGQILYQINKEGLNIIDAIDFVWKQHVPVEINLSNSNRTPAQVYCYASVGASRFYVGFDPLGIYTNIGADNRHHAMNKATKLWRDGWTTIRNGPPIGRTWEWVSVKEYGALINEYQQLRKGA